MGSITYTAVDRGELVAGHTAGTPYTINTEFQEFPRTLHAKGDRDETLDGRPEGWLYALQREYQVRTDIILLADRANWREFFSSVMNGEQFQINFDGTPLDVWLVDDQIQEQQIGGVAVQYQFRVKVLP